MSHSVLRQRFPERSSQIFGEDVLVRQGGVQVLCFLAGRPRSRNGPRNQGRHRAPEAVRIQTFMDDLAFAVRGTQSVRRLHMAIVILIWRELWASPLEPQGSSRSVCAVDWLLAQVFKSRPEIV